MGLRLGNLLSTRDATSTATTLNGVRKCGLPIRSYEASHDAPSAFHPPRLLRMLLILLEQGLITLLSSRLDIPQRLLLLPLPLNLLRQYLARVEDAIRVFGAYEASLRLRRVLERAALAKVVLALRDDRVRLGMPRLPAYQAREWQLQGNQDRK